MVVDVQRLSRGDLEDCGRLIKLLRYTGTKVITPQKIYDLDDEYDRDAFERELKRGNEYLEYFKRFKTGDACSPLLPVITLAVYRLMGLIKYLSWKASANVLLLLLMKNLRLSY